MPDFGNLIDGIKAIFQLIFGKNIPPWLFTTVGWGLLIIGILCAIWGILFVLSKIKELWIQSFLPLFYNDEKRRRSVQRRNFAGYVKDEILKLDRNEDWKDFRFAELEAEVEAEGRRRILGVVPILMQTESGLRREPSLTKALASSQDRLILVEGEPGSGKSVALRHVALAMAKHAEGTNNIDSIIPIYVNLKELERPEGATIDRKFIESFVLNCLKRINDRFVEQFLDDEFGKGLANGTWFFLFDSFDELPEVLSSTESDPVVRQYGEAIDDFLHGGNRCRGVVASRQFRGPDHFGWPRFRVLPLSEKRRLDLIRKMNLGRERESEFIGQLAIANQEVRSMARNPLLLTLLCEHVRNGHPFPQNTYTVFETYITNRLTRDEARVQLRFQLNAAQLREAAERIAFCMAADPGLGLSPTRDYLQDALVRLHMGIENDFSSLLDALEYIKLARSDVASGTQSPSFTFAHRRFQEYFATCVVLREPTRISWRELLTNARWRETAVVICQTQPIDQLAMIIEEADQLLAHYCSTIPGIPEETSVEGILNATQETASPDFSFPPGVYHLFGLLQDGFSRRLEDIPTGLRMSVGMIALFIFRKGTTIDKKWILEVAGLAPVPILTDMLNSAFSGSSQWLKDIAYRQVARLHTISPEIAQGIRNAIIDLADTDCLYRERYATKAHLSRMNQSANFLTIMKLMLWLPSIDLGLHILLFILFLSLSNQAGELSLSTTVPLSFFLLSSHMFFRLRYIIPSKLSIPTFLFLRGEMCIIPAFIFFQPLKLYPLIFLILGALFVLSYTYSAIGAAKSGKFVKEPWWPFMSFWPVLYLFVYPRPTLAFLREAVKDGLLEGIGIVILVIIVFGGIIVLWITIVAKYFPLLYTIGVILAYIVVALLVLFFAVIIILGAYNTVRDWFRWKGNQPGQLTCEELLNTLGLYHTLQFRMRLVRLIREQHLLVATDEQEGMLRKVLFATEARFRSPVSTSGWGSEINKMIRDATLIVGGPSNYALRDELWQLLDELHAFRQGELVGTG